MRHRAHPTLLYLPLLALPVASALVAPLAAQDTLATVRVVASPVVHRDSVDRFGGLRSRVDARQLRELNAIDLASALRRVPGVAVSRFNAVGAFGGSGGGAVFVRGLGAGRPGGEVKTYVDGAPFYMGVWNHPLLDLLPVRAMERVTIVKGPQPMTFGNTFGAVDLETRTATDDGVHGALGVQAGRFGTIVQDAAVTVSAERLRLSGTQGIARSDGHRPDSEGRLVNGVLRAEYDVAPGATVFVTGLVVDNRARDPGMEGVPATRTGVYETRGTLVTAGLRHGGHVGAIGIQGSVQLHRSGGDGDWLGQPPPDGDTRASFVLRGVRAREVLDAWPGGSVLVGLDIDEMTGDVRFDLVAPAAAAHFDGPTLRLVQPVVGVSQRVSLNQRWSLVPAAGARGYAHSEFAGAIAPHAGLVVAHAGGSALRATWAQGINYPGVDVAALASTIPALGESWRSLAAERLSQTEVGGTLVRDAGPARFELDASLFDARARDRYVFAFPPLSVPPAFRNLGSYRIRGAETSVRVAMPAGVAVFAGATWLASSIATLPNAPARQFSGGLTVTRPWIHLAVDAQAQSGMYVNALARNPAATNGARVGGFTVWHARVALPVPVRGATQELFASVENLGNARYAYLPGYPMPRRWVLAGVRATW